jgi:transposase-like protein
MPRPETKAPYSKRRRWRARDARTALDAAAASGLSVGEFAKREGLVAERLYRWQRRFAREPKTEARAPTPPAAPAIIELRPTMQREAAGSVEIVLVSGVVLRVAETIDPDAVARLVAALEREC